MFEQQRADRLSKVLLLGEVERCEQPQSDGLAVTVAGVPGGGLDRMADRVPERRMGVFGVVLILIGFSLQSVQYWVTLLDVSVR